MNKIQYEIALNDAKGAAFSTRHGDIESDFNLGGEGVRIIVHNFGNYAPFLLSNGTKDWLKRAYKLTEKQAYEVFRYLVSSAKADLKDSERASQRQAKSSTQFVKPHPYIEGILRQTRS
jgi:hypothetical protein